jgi:hypothetical protein
VLANARRLLAAANGASGVTAERAPSGGAGLALAEHAAAAGHHRCGPRHCTSSLLWPLRAVPAPGAAARRRATRSWTRASPPPRGRNRAHASTTRSVGSAYFELYRKSIEIPIELVL